MSASDPYDVAIIGAGVVGCALARRFTLDGARVAVLEKAVDVLDGASKGNSAILHTGFDAPTRSLEQRCVAEGYAEYQGIHSDLGLPLIETGAMVLAWSPDQMDRLDALIDQAHANGVTDVRPLTLAQIKDREPNLSDAVLGGFLVPGEAIIDPWSAPHAYLAQAVLNGAHLRCSTEVLGGRFDGEGWHLDTSHGPVSARTVITAAGLYGDIVDQRLTGRSAFSIHPRKGQFVVFDKAAAPMVRSIILPVPTEITKGVVICQTAFGNVLVGPTAEDQDSRTDASTDHDALATLYARGIEMIPALATCEVTATYAGLRPASEHKDYQIGHDSAQNYWSVGAIRSTGLSGALGIARHVATLIGGNWQALANPAHPAPYRLAEECPRDWQDTGHGRIICHCELVTEREIHAAFDGPVPANSLAGIKRRTRACMGRCQGFYCLGAVTQICQHHLGADREDSDAA